MKWPLNALYKADEVKGFSGVQGKSHWLLKWLLNTLQLHITCIQYLHNQCPIHDHGRLNYFEITYSEALYKADGQWIRKRQVTAATISDYLF